MIISSRVRRVAEALCHRDALDQRRWSANRITFELAITEQERRGSFQFVQVGACNGVTGDPIHERVRRGGWSGILVEPQRFESERLKSNYAGESERLSFENLAISDAQGTRMLYGVEPDCIEAEWQRGIASFFPLEWLDPARVAAEPAQCISFDALLQRHHLWHINLLQVDVEGCDFEILKLARIERLRPDLIRYEHRHSSLSDAHECKAYLRRSGYEVLPMQHATGAICRT